MLWIFEMMTVYPFRFYDLEKAFSHTIETILSLPAHTLYYLFIHVKDEGELMANYYIFVAQLAVYLFGVYSSFLHSFSRSLMIHNLHTGLTIV